MASMSPTCCSSCVASLGVKRLPGSSSNISCCANTRNTLYKWGEDAPHAWAIYTASSNAARVHVNQQGLRAGRGQQRVHTAPPYRPIYHLQPLEYQQ